ARSSARCHARKPAVGNARARASGITSDRMPRNESRRADPSRSPLPGEAARSDASGDPMIAAGSFEFLHPADWAAPKGYANGIAAAGRIVFVGGQIGWNASQHFESDDFVVQARQALANIVSVLAEAGAG